MSSINLALPWLEPGDFFPATDNAWGYDSDAPGLLAAGGDLTVQSLNLAYRNGIFPWFSDGQPILWWSTDPRMVLQTSNFKLHRSFAKTLHRFRENPICEVRIDSAFAAVIQACAGSSRKGQPGTWIVPDMVEAYTRLHHAGQAHSVETWVNGELMGGLYCVSIGKMVFGESMFAKAPDASKIALAALVAFCRKHAMPLIDCQQNTQHLASLGAAEIPRLEFLTQVQNQTQLSKPVWRFDSLYWDYLLRPQNDLT